MPKEYKQEDLWQGLKCDIDCHDKPIELVMIADLHIGDKSYKADLAQELINGVKDNENRYCILGGDLMNTAIAGSKSDIYQEQLSPMQELEKAVELVEPIKDKVVAVLPGNHEERIERNTGAEMMHILAAELGLQDLYTNTAALIFLKFGRDRHGRRMSYTIYANHGNGGGAKVGSKLTKLADYAQIVDADVYIVGHTHLPASFKQVTYRVVPEQCYASPHEQLFVNTASALGYEGYGKRGGYVPSSNSYPIITLDNTVKKATVTL